MFRRSLLIPALSVAALALSLAACTEDDNGDSTGSDGGSEDNYWYVGNEGTMFRVDEHGNSARVYPLDEDGDLLAIACRGAEEAWVVGEGGTLLSTFDGGETWDYLESDVSETLTAVAVDADFSVWAAGHHGALLVSEDAGSSWTAIEAADQSFTGVSANAAGDVAVLSAANGSIWLLEDRELTQVYSGSAALDDVWMTPGAEVMAAVGEEGSLVESRDGGTTWARVPLDTSRDLHAVYVSGNGRTTLAVGEAGVIVRLGEDDSFVGEWLDPELSLRDLHVSAHHVGHAVGDAGTALKTYDAGASWEPMQLDTLADFTALDQLHAEPHL